MNGIDVRVVQDFIECPVAARETEAFGGGLGFFGRGTQDARDMDARASEGFHVNRSDESRSHDGGVEWLSFVRHGVRSVGGS